MRTNAIVRIILFSVLIVLLLGILVVGIAARYFSFSIGLGYFDTGSTPGNHLQYETSTGFDSASVPVDSLKALEIQWASGSITIQTDDTDVITISEPSGLPEDQRLCYRVSGDRLVISYYEKMRLFSFNLGSMRKDLTVTVPKDWDCRELNIEAASANCTITDFSPKTLDLDNASGDYVLKNMNCQSVEYDTASGSISYTGTVEYFDADSASADCNLVLSNTPREVSFDSASGDMDLTLPGDAGFTAELDSASGKLSCDFPDCVIRSGRLTYGDGSGTIDADTASGNLTIRKG